MRADGMVSRRQSGMGMIEVLVTLVILLVGLLGLAGLMTQAQRSEMESYQRVQALILLQDMVSRLNSNREVTAYQVASAGSDGAKIGTTLLNCDSVTLNPNSYPIATRDICAWHDAVLGTAETAGGGASVGAMIGGRGCISYNAATERLNTSAEVVATTLDGAPENTAVGGRIPNSGTYTVSVAWQGLGVTFDDPDRSDCGEGEYGADDAGRRVVSEPVRFATLTM